MREIVLEIPDEGDDAGRVASTVLKEDIYLFQAGEHVIFTTTTKIRGEFHSVVLTFTKEEWKKLATGPAYPLRST